MAKKKKCFPLPLYRGKSGRQKIMKRKNRKLESFFFLLLIKGVGTRHGERDSMVGN